MIVLVRFHGGPIDGQTRYIDAQWNFYHLARTRPSADQWRYAHDGDDPDGLPRYVLDRVELEPGA